MLCYAGDRGDDGAAAGEADAAAHRQARGSHPGAAGRHGHRQVRRALRSPYA